MGGSEHRENFLARCVENGICQKYNPAGEQALTMLVDRSLVKRRGEVRGRRMIVADDIFLGTVTRATLCSSFGLKTRSSSVRRELRVAQHHGIEGRPFRTLTLLVVWKGDFPHQWIAKLLFSANHWAHNTGLDGAYAIEVLR